VKREYAKTAGIEEQKSPEPKDIYEIATGQQTGNKEAALKAFQHMAEAIGDAAANVSTLIDGLVVFGGGIAGAQDIFLPRLIDEMNSNFKALDGSEFPRMAVKAFNYENVEEKKQFLAGSTKQIKVPFSDKIINYDPLMRIGVGTSKIGTSEAISIGAYAFALNQIDQKV
jgi:glucokinase